MTTTAIKDLSEISDSHLESVRAAVFALGCGELIDSHVKAADLMAAALGTLLDEGHLADDIEVDALCFVNATLAPPADFDPIDHPWTGKKLRHADGTVFVAEYFVHSKKWGPLAAELQGEKVAYSAVADCELFVELAGDPKGLELVAHIKEYAKKCYSYGWDFVVEAMEDGEILDAFGDCRTKSGVMRIFREMVASRREQAKNVSYECCPCG